MIILFFRFHFDDFLIYHLQLSKLGNNSQAKCRMGKSPLSGNVNQVSHNPIFFQNLPSTIFNIKFSKKSQLVVLQTIFKMIHCMLPNRMRRKPHVKRVKFSDILKSLFYFFQDFYLNCTLNSLVVINNIFY